MTGAPRITATTHKRPPPDPVETKTPYAFVHINKCGGSSVEIALGIGKRHATAIAMRDKMGREAWEAAFTFTVVRNPFSRVASIYYYRVRTDQAGLADRHLSFNAWVAKAWGERDPVYVGEPALMSPCAEWVFENDKMLVDVIARQETLGKDWPEICERLGIDRPLPRTNWNAYPHYRRIFSTEARALIEAEFAADLAIWGYEY